MELNELVERLAKVAKKKKEIEAEEAKLKKELLEVSPPAKYKVNGVTISVYNRTVYSYPEQIERQISMLKEVIEGVREQARKLNLARATEQKQVRVQVVREVEK